MNEIKQRQWKRKIINFKKQLTCGFVNSWVLKFVWLSENSSKDGLSCNTTPKTYKITLYHDLIYQNNQTLRKWEVGSSKLYL